MVAKNKMLQIRVSDEQLAKLKERAAQAGLSVSSYLLAVGLSEESSAWSPIPSAVTTADKLPTPKRKVNPKLCRSCQKAGVAAWNCRQCSPSATSHKPVNEEVSR